MICDGNSHDTGPISCPRITLDWPSALVCGDVKEKKEGFELEMWELTHYLQGVVGQVRWGESWGSENRDPKSTSSLPLQAGQLEADKQTHNS